MAGTTREAGTNTRDRAQTGKKQAHTSQARPKQHSWDKHDDYHKTCRDCGIKALARPHPCEPRWYQEYTTADGCCFVAERVPPCQPAGSLPAAAAERAGHGTTRSPNRAVPGGHAPRRTRTRTPTWPPGGRWKPAARGGARTGTPSATSAKDIATRLAAAGYTTRSPELAEIRAWNHAARQRAATADAEADTETGQ